MITRYGGRPNLLGIELLNEPSQFYSENNHTVLLQYYTDAYHIIRQHSATALVVFNELYAPLFSRWNDALSEPDFYNVVLDLHLYQFMYEKWNVYQHVALAKVSSAFASTTVVLDGYGLALTHHATRLLPTCTDQSWQQLVEAFQDRHPLVVGEWSMGTGTLRQAGQPYVDACVASFERTHGWCVARTCPQASSTGNFSFTSRASGLLCVCCYQVPVELEDSTGHRLRRVGRAAAAAQGRTGACVGGRMSCLAGTVLSPPMPDLP